MYLWFETTLTVRRNARDIHRRETNARPSDPVIIVALSSRFKNPVKRNWTKIKRKRITLPSRQSVVVLKALVFFPTLPAFQQNSSWQSCATLPRIHYGLVLLLFRLTVKHCELTALPDLPCR
jgi:hypothetical protein